MKTIVLGVGELGSSKTTGQSVKTYALGSCVAVIFTDVVKHIVGMVHIALPESKIDKNKAETLPGYFADTGISKLIAEMKLSGAAVPSQNLMVKLVGGAQILDPNNTFNIGKRNVMAIRKILWKLGMGAKSEEIGGNISRTVSVGVDSCIVTINSSTGKKWTI